VEQSSLPLLRVWPDPEIITTKAGEQLRLIYKLVQTTEALVEMRDVLSAQPEIAYDTETSGLYPHLGARIAGHALATRTRPSEITAWYVPIRHQGPEDQLATQLPVEIVSPAVAHVLRSSGLCDYQHAKFDWAQARADGIIPTRDFYDVSILATINDENEPSFGLKAMATKYVCDSAQTEADELEKWMKKDARSLGLAFKKRTRMDVASEELGEPTYLERFGFARTPIMLCGKYACKDVFYTLYLRQRTFKDTHKKYPEVCAREHAVAKILHKMEWRGLPADETLIRKTHDETGAELRHWIAEVRRFVGDPQFAATDDEVRVLLYEKLKLEPPKRTKGEAEGAVDRESRTILARKHPEHAELLAALDALADAKKLHSTYSGSFLRYLSPSTGCIHPSYNQLEQRDHGRQHQGVPVTGRLSSSYPNVQNIQIKPIKLRSGVEVAVRRYFLVPRGFIRAYIDFSQIEVRTLAYITQDPILLRVYANDEDVHGVVAAETGVPRRAAKRIVFGTNYGATEMAIARQLPGYASDPEGTRTVAKQYIAAYFARFPSIPRFRVEFARRMRANKSMFVNPFGRPRRLPDISEKTRWKRERAERQMMASLISGTAADIMKESMIRCDAILEREYPDGSAANVQTIHDELVFDLPLRSGWTGVLIKLVQAMEDWPQFSSKGVPIKVSVELSTTTWEDKKAIKILPDGRFQWAT